MPRPLKKEINLSKESILSLMQEIYNELVEQRNTALRIQNKMLTMMKEPEDMTLIGPVIEKQQKIINDCVEKKLSLSKLQASIWEKTNSSKESFFSKKRIESGIAFIIAQWGMIFFLLEKHSTLTMTDLIMWAGVEFAISGYIIHQIQKEKKTDEQKEETPNE